MIQRSTLMPCSSGPWDVVMCAQEPALSTLVIPLHQQEKLRAGHMHVQAPAAIVQEAQSCLSLPTSRAAWTANLCWLNFRSLHLELQRCFRVGGAPVAWHLVSLITVN